MDGSDLILRELEKQRCWLAFPPELEKAYFASRVPSDSRAAKVACIVGSLTFASFWFFDRLIVPDIPQLYTVVRLAYAVPTATFCAMYLRWPTSCGRDIILTCAALTTQSLEMVLMLSSDAPMRSALLMGLPLLLLFLLSLHLVTFRAALMIVATLTPLMVFAVKRMHELPYEIVFCVYMILASMLMTMLTMTYMGERERRWIFLLDAISSLQKQHLEEISEIDPLTQLRNRRWLEARKPAMFGQAYRNNKSIAAVMLDIDHFKAFNDIYGHSAGDTCIAAVAEHTVKAVGGAGQAVRMGGEEILVLFEGCDLPQAIAYAERIRTAILAQAIPHAGNTWGVVTVSVGCASLVPHADDTSAQSHLLVTAADAELYNAKRSGRNTVRPEAPRSHATERGGAWSTERVSLDVSRVA